MNLNTPIRDISKITAVVAPKFSKLGLKTIGDLLFYFPFRYEDYSKLLKIQDIQPGVLLTIKVKIELLESRRSFHKKMILVEAVVADETGKVKVIWFNQRYIQRTLVPGDEVYLSGKAIETGSGIEFHNPTFEKVNKYDNFTAHTARIVPIYSTTEKLTERQIRFAMKRALMAVSQISDWLPKEIVDSAGLMQLQRAIYQIHFPSNDYELEKAKFRLKFNEIFLLQARSRLIKQELLHLKAEKIIFNETKTKKFVNGLPFKLTESQKKSAWKIIKDLGKIKPMNRLLEGDVGSGKTIAVAIAILNVLLNKKQVAYMAPTEILASQQFQSLCKIFSGYDFNIALLTRTQAKIFSRNVVHEDSGLRSTLKKQPNGQSTQNIVAQHSYNVRKLDLIKKISSGEADLIIGTHSLIQDKINFKDLDFVIIDEQHRFGITQRKQLQTKAREQKDKIDFSPHFLSMTATPIPRSLALTVYGDLDLSVIDEMPKNRKKIETRVVEPHERKNAYNFVDSEISKGRQVFVVCPLIDPSDKLGAKAVKDVFEKLDKKIFKNIKMGILHGKIQPEEKEKIMREFLENKIKILVSTSVIEVGIDVPNATVMMIESAERFGLAQLHQLRGRVGRSGHQSYCLLFTESDSENTFKRMRALVQSANGFELAEKDLEFRGPGEVYGIRQSGFFDSLKIAKLTDWSVIQAVQVEIEKIFTTDPTLNNHLEIKEKIKDFEKNVHLE
ncbi:MAG: ATP-dependent DNA helicase RecG [Patescibacteria group bacterium]